jgi:heat shock protein HtpX
MLNAPKTLTHSTLSSTQTTSDQVLQGVFRLAESMRKRNQPLATMISLRTSFRPRQPMLSRRALEQQRIFVRRETFLLGGALSALFSVTAFLVGGWWITSFAAATIGISIFVHLRQRPSLILRLFRTRPMSRLQFPRLCEVVDSLSVRAGMSTRPAIHWIPSHAPIAFTAGTGKNATIAISDGLLHRLSERELAAVLAHELAHQRHGDLRLLAAVNTMRQVVGILALATFGLLLLSLPAFLWSSAPFRWGSFLWLMLAPSLMGLLALGFSRAREFAADLGAAELTGDPLALASALEKIDVPPASPWRRFFPSLAHAPEEHLLRTHPPSRERIQRLHALVERRPRRFSPLIELLSSL